MEWSEVSLSEEKRTLKTKVGFTSLSLFQMGEWTLLIFWYALYTSVTKVLRPVAHHFLSSGTLYPLFTPLGT